jgi:hypothetical protein
MAYEQTLPMNLWKTLLAIGGLASLLGISCGGSQPAPNAVDSSGDVATGDGGLDVDQGVRADVSQSDVGGQSELGMADLADGGEWIGGCAPNAAKINVNSLLAEMTDLGVLARRSPVKFTTHEASSYDRRSVTPVSESAVPDGWFANTDWGNYLRVEQTSRGAEYVMADAVGPGAIVRLWTANGQEGTLRIYLDDMSTPAITADFVALLSGQVQPFTSPFSVVNSTGRNLDFPLPFRARAKVTVTGSATIPASAYFYQVFYRTYAPCADVETYRQEAISPTSLEGARKGMLAGASDQSSSVAMTEERLDATKPTLLISASEGGEEITELIIRPDALDTRSLRQGTLALSFDGHQTTLVPLGDFFGAGPGLLAHKTLPLEVRDDGTLISRFVMPFATEARLTVGLASGHSAMVQVRHRARKFESSTFHFFAHWTARGPIPSRPFRDHVLADVSGEGAFVGTMLSHDDLSTEWWGEGDEKIWVDGEGFPSLFGTGTEDYFGYAYSSRESFDHAYRLLRPTGVSRGQLTNARFHILDAIRFETALKFELEEWHWDPAVDVFFDTLVYFYGRPGTVDKLDQPAPGDFRLPSHP